MPYDPIDIRTSSDLKHLTKSGIIKKDIVIRGEHIKALEGVEKIEGFLGISDSNIESLGLLEEITGNFWISSHTVYSPLTKLGNLKKVGGDLYLRYSNVIDLGNLKEVKGKVDLRDTNLIGLYLLKIIGGDLFLPKRLKGGIDLSKVSIKGKIRYWNDKKDRKNITPKSQLGLVKYPKGVPHWSHQYIHSNNELESATAQQQQFYSHYKKCFFQGFYLDIEGNYNYSFILFYDLLVDYRNHKDIHRLQEQFKILGKYYPITKAYTSFAVIKEFEDKRDYETSWKLWYLRKFISLETIYKYEHRLNRPLIDGNIIVKLGGYSHLTEFGQKNIKKIKPYAEKQLVNYEKEKGCKFTDVFFKKPSSQQVTDTSSIPSYNPEYYKQFCVSEQQYHSLNELDIRQVGIKGSHEIKHVVKHAILNQFRIILNKAEDLYRESFGLPKVGEGWISETELFYKIVDAFPQHKVVHHARPKWLGRQHIDIYFPELKIGIEYQGSQHYFEVDFFGGKDALEKVRENDEKKRKKCEKYQCSLIYVDEDYDFEKVKQSIQKVIQQE